MTNTAITQHSAGAIMSPDDLRQQVNTIQQVMNSVMKKGEHYGVIPGTGDKPTLLKPGAEKIALTFGFAPSYEVLEDRDGEHREYRVTCTLTHRNTGNVIGEGVGCCSTKEGKYRYRSENTGAAVPPEYWDNRDKASLGGPAYSAKKVAGEWMIVHRVEHDNPADYANTVLKMAKKRAFVDAVLTNTAASDCFTQDVEDMPEVINADPRGQEQDQGQEQTQAPKRDTAHPGDKKDAPPQGEGTYSVTRVDTKSGTGKNGDWVKYGVRVEGVGWMSTFDDRMGSIASNAADTNERVFLRWSSDKYGLKLEAIRPVAGESSVGPDPDEPLADEDIPY